MDFLNQFFYGLNIYFNFYAFANLLAGIFTLLVAVFLLTLKHRSKSTTALGLVFATLTPFNFIYFLAHAYYGPLASYHRWFTVGLILAPAIHMAQWAYKFPENTHPRAARLTWVLQYLVSITFTVAFIVITLRSHQVFILNGQLWDFDADLFSKIFGAVIMLFFFYAIGVGAWKSIKTKGKDRWTIAFIMGSIFVAFFIPALFNVAQRDGRITRDTFVITFTLATVLGYFGMLVLYINRTKDRTSFMAKILGVSLVTFLLMMQGISFFTLRDREEEYDSLRIQYAERALEGGERHDDIRYIVRYNPGDDSIAPAFMPTPAEVDFEGHKEDLANAMIYGQLRALDDVNFRESALSLIGQTRQPFFSGYRDLIKRFIDSSNLEDDQLREALFAFLAKIRTDTQVASNKVHAMKEEKFREELLAYIAKTEDRLQPIQLAMEAYLTAHPDLQGAELKRDIMRFLAPFEKEETRHFRRIMGENKDHYRHYTGFVVVDEKQNVAYEVGFDYLTYRRYMSPAALQQILILLIVLVVLLYAFPRFFSGSLITPLNELVGGVTQVNGGDLTTKVPVHVHDEIGFLASSFNSMVVSIRDAQEKLQDYANNLEEKVKERTAELKQTLDEVRALKTQQDGDYFLTSLLQKPLNYNANKSKLISTAFYLEQKKKFEFRTKKADLGGDICLTGNLRLGTPEKHKRYIVALNGDAMGKSMQGAGGSLVMGVVMNTIMARSAKNNRIMNTTPERWLTDVYEEIHGVFMAFNGSMVISCVLAAIDEQSGEMFYFNAEHPHTVLYRNGRASFIEEELQLRKLGLESEIPFKVQFFQLQRGDVVIMGSDGRDDLDLTPGEVVRTINEDEYLFLRRVEEGDGDIHRMVDAIKSYGELTDDLSFVRIGFHEQTADLRSSESVVEPERVIIDIDIHDELESMHDKALEGADLEFEDLFSKGRSLARDGKLEEALQYLNRAYTLRADVPALNKIMGVLTFKERDYNRAVEILSSYLEHDPGLTDFWLYLSISNKRIGEYHQALEAAQKVYNMSPDRVVNLINLADIHHKLGNYDRAREYIERALDIDPQNRHARQLQASLS
ncbi:MAG: SpoIIE family protein phosphatase [Leptospirales bacterium]|nr:SpoIIE family protein phosphatase [Leptospirales bacterium]